MKKYGKHELGERRGRKVKGKRCGEHYAYILLFEYVSCK